MYQAPCDRASCSWLMRPIPVARFWAPVSGSISQTQPEVFCGSAMNGNSSLTRNVPHGVRAPAHRSCRPVVISSRLVTVVPSRASVRRETEASPLLSPSSVWLCSGTAHLPRSPWKSPLRGCVSSWALRSWTVPPFPGTATLASKSPGMSNVAPDSVDVTLSPPGQGWPAGVAAFAARVRTS